MVNSCNVVIRNRAHLDAPTCRSWSIRSASTPRRGSRGSGAAGARVLGRGGPAPPGKPRLGRTAERRPARSTPRSPNLLDVEADRVSCAARSAPPRDLRDPPDGRPDSARTHAGGASPERRRARRLYRRESLRRAAPGRHLRDGQWASARWSTASFGDTASRGCAWPIARHATVPGGNTNLPAFMSARSAPT